MSDKEQRISGLCLQLENIDDDVLKEAYLTDSKEALDNLKKKNKKGRRFIIKEINEGLRTVAACFLVCLLVAGGLLVAVKFRGGSFGDISYTTPGNNLTSPSTSTVWDSKVDAETVWPETENMRDVYTFEIGHLEEKLIVEYSRDRMDNASMLAIESEPHLSVVKVDSVEDIRELSDIVAGRNKGYERIFSHMDEDYFKNYIFYFIYLPTNNAGGEYVIDSKSYTYKRLTMNIKCMQKGSAEAMSGWFFSVGYSKTYVSKYDFLDAVYHESLECQYDYLGIRDVCISEIGRTSLFSENETLKELVVNKDKLDITTEKHQAVYKIDSVSERDLVLDILVEMEEGILPCRGYKPMQEVLRAMDDSYFKEYTLYAIYLATPISLGIYEFDRFEFSKSEMSIYIRDDSMVGLCTVSGWMFTVAVPKSLSDTFTSVDCIYFKAYDNK